MVPTGRLAWWHVAGGFGIDHDDDPAQSGRGTAALSYRLETIGRHSPKGLY